MQFLNPSATDPGRNIWEMEMAECLICFQPFSIENIPSLSYQLYNVSFKYLHSDIIKDARPIMTATAGCLLCPKCHRSALQLADIAKQLEFYQKTLAEFVELFSSEILQRRNFIPTETETVDISPHFGQSEELGNTFLTESYSEEIEYPILCDALTTNITPDIVIEEENIDINENGKFNRFGYQENGNEINDSEINNSESNNGSSSPKVSVSLRPKIRKQGSSRRTATVFKCEVCGKEFSSKIYGEVHLRSHTGEKPFQCSVCKERFVTSSCMSRHQRIVHQLCFKCAICNKAFKLNRQLNSHMQKQHSKKSADDTEDLTEKKVNCNVCGNDFENLKLFYEHYQRTHSLESLNRSTNLVTSTPELVVLEDSDDDVNYVEENIEVEPEITHEHSGNDVMISDTPFKELVQFGTRTQDEDSENKDEHFEIINSVAQPSLDRNHVNSSINDYIEKVIKGMINCSSSASSTCATTTTKSKYPQKPISSGIKDTIIPSFLKLKRLQFQGNGKTIIAFHKQHEKCKVHQSIWVYQEAKNNYTLQKEVLNSESSKSPPSLAANDIVDDSVSVLVVSEVNDTCTVDKQLDCSGSALKKDVKDGSLDCKICGKSFHSKRNLRLHTNEHIRAEPHRCDICEKTFTRASTLLLHRRVVHKIGIQFSKPDRQFSSKERPQNSDLPKPISQLPLHFYVPQKSFQPTYIPPHNQSDHREKESSQILISNETLNTTVGSAQPQPDNCEVFTCILCQKTFPRLFNLARHYRMKHGEKKFRCQTCGKMFAEKESLNMHVKNAHTSQKLLKCNQCDYSTLRIDYLSNHEAKKHSGTRPVKCTLCGSNFKTIPDLKRHHSRVHLGIKFSSASWTLSNNTFNSEFLKIKKRPKKKLLENTAPTAVSDSVEVIESGDSCTFATYSNNPENEIQSNFQNKRQLVAEISPVVKIAHVIPSPVVKLKRLQFQENGEKIFTTSRDVESSLICDNYDADVDIWIKQEPGDYYRREEV